MNRVQVLSLRIPNFDSKTCRACDSHQVQLVLGIWGKTVGFQVSPPISKKCTRGLGRAYLLLANAAMRVGISGGYTARCI
jgi:hypothetical protein